MSDVERDLEKVLATLPNAVNLSYGRTDGGSDEDPSVTPDRVVASFNFSEPGFGFGEVTIVQTAEGVFLDAERMSLGRVKRYLSALVDSAISDSDEDPDRHALYNRVMGRRCSDACQACARWDAKQ